MESQPLEMPNIPDLFRRSLNPAWLRAETKGSVVMAKVRESEAPAAAKGKPPVKAAAKPKAAPKAAAKANGKANGAKAAKPAREAAARDKFGIRDGSLKSQAAGMYTSKKGATMNEVKEALGSVQLNVIKELKEAGHKVREVKEGGEGTRQVTRYFVT